MADEFSDWLEALKAKVNVADLVSAYVPLVQKGSRKWACCPFHHEKTPSFCVDEYKNTYYCFGCHKGGDAINFVMEIEQLDFISAVRMLGDKYRMPMPQKHGDGEKAREERRHKDSLYEMMRESGMFYNRMLTSTKKGEDRGEAARNYLALRGITPSTARVFGLGYSPDYTQLPTHLRSLGYRDADMLEAGVVKEKNGRVYDVMAERLIVPIFNGVRKVVAFGGRTLKSDGMPKYKNTEGTPLFNKSQELFGQHSVKHAKLEETIDSLIVVEGYMDVISLYQSGIHNVMASMGTSLTEEQARILKRYCDKVYICYDGDSAGQKATVRGMDILAGAGLEVKVVSLPEGLDPDEYVRKYGKKGYLDVLYGAKPLFEFKLHNLASGFDLKTPEGRGEFADRAVKLLKSLGSPVKIEAYLPVVMALSGFSRDVLYRQLSQEKETVTPLPKSSSEKTVVGEGLLDKSVRYVLFALFGGVADAREAVDIDLSCYIESAEQQALYDYFRSFGEDKPNLKDLTEYDGGTPEALAAIDEGEKISDEQSIRYLGDCVKRIKNHMIKKQREELLKLIDATKDEEERSMLMARFAQLEFNKL